MRENQVRIIIYHLDQLIWHMNQRKLIYDIPSG